MNEQKVREEIQKIVTESAKRSRRQYPVGVAQKKELEALGILHLMPAKYGFSDAAAVLRAAKKSKSSAFNAAGEGDEIDVHPLYAAIHEIEIVTVEEKPAVQRTPRRRTSTIELPNLHQDDKKIRALIAQAIDLKQRCSFAKRFDTPDGTIFDAIMDFEDTILKVADTYDPKGDWHYAPAGQRLVYASRIVRIAIAEASVTLFDARFAEEILQEVINIMRSCYADVEQYFPWLTADQR